MAIPYAVSLAMVHLSRLADDLIIFTGEEHAFSSCPIRLRPVAA